MLSSYLEDFIRNNLNENSLLFLFLLVKSVCFTVEWPKGGVAGCAISWGDG
jgi:hypothetical protein